MSENDTASGDAFPEDVAHRLLARAVELDVERASRVSVAQLRDIALEAGISLRAFDEALAESRDQSPALPRAPRAWLRPLLTNVFLLGDSGTAAWH